LNLQKLDKEIFESVLIDNQLVPHRVLFIDDQFENVQAAKVLGFQTIHFNHRITLLKALRKFGVF
jgi:HAD superfamily hydrolase (TIGR01509 family)